MPSLKPLGAAPITGTLSVVAHPYASAAVLLFWAFYPKLPFQILYFVLYDLPRSIFLGLATCLGFERYGVRQGRCYHRPHSVYHILLLIFLEDSLASRYQSQFYTSSGGIFSRSRSYAAINEPRSYEDINNDLPPPYNGTASHPRREADVRWTILGWFCVYAALVIVLTYGDGDF